MAAGPPSSEGPPEQASDGSGMPKRRRPGGDVALAVRSGRLHHWNDSPLACPLLRLVSCCVNPVAAWAASCMPCACCMSQCLQSVDSMQRVWFAVLHSGQLRGPAKSSEGALCMSAMQQSARHSLTVIHGAKFAGIFSDARHARCRWRTRYRAARCCSGGTRCGTPWSSSCARRFWSRCCGVTASTSRPAT